MNIKYRNLTDLELIREAIDGDELSIELASRFESCYQILESLREQMSDIVNAVDTCDYEDNEEIEDDDWWYLPNQTFDKIDSISSMLDAR
jgi:hypothetical protein